MTTLLNLDSTGGRPVPRDDGRRAVELQKMGAIVVGVEDILDGELCGVTHLSKEVSIEVRKNIRFGRTLL